MDELRIYVAVAKAVQVPADRPRRSIDQPLGRQIAQACHVVSKLRHNFSAAFEPVTTIILQARDSAELRHIQTLLLKKKLNVVPFFDTNSDAYGPAETVMTAVAVLASKKQIENIMDYLPLWGT
jgi:hypothetical protein